MDTLLTLVEEPLSPDGSPIAWSLTLAVVCVPMQRRIEAVIRSPGVAAAISVFLIGSVVLVLVTFVGERLGREASSGAQLVNARIESGEWRRAIELHPRLVPLADWLEHQNLPETVKSTVTWMSTTGAGFVRGSVIEVMSLLLTFYLLFYVLRDRRCSAGFFGRFDVLVAGSASPLFCGAWLWVYWP